MNTTHNFSGHHPYLKLITRIAFLLHFLANNSTYLLGKYDTTLKIKNIIPPKCSDYGRGKVYTGFWWENLRERNHWGEPGVDVRMVLRRIFRKWNLGVWTGLSWLRIETGGGHL
jgi:hypothetical protein